MHSLAPETDVRAMNVVLDDARLVVDLMDGRTIAVPLAWYPRLANATPQQRNRRIARAHIAQIAIGSRNFSPARGTADAV